MGHFYAPPPPIVSATGAQPYAPNKLPPAITAVPVNNPPFYSRTELPNILRQWQPPDPQPTLTTRSVGNPGWSVDNPPAYTRYPLPYPETLPLPQTLVLLPQPGTTVVVVQTPYVNQWCATVLAAWQPQDPLPTLPTRQAGKPGWSIDNPPQLVRQSFAYDVPPPLLQSLILQPQPFTTTIPVQNPYTNAWIINVIGAWQPADPAPTLSFKLNPQIIAVPVNNPPFNSRTELPNILAQWQPPPPLPAPSIRINIVQGGAAPIITVREWIIRARRRRR